MNQVTQVQLEQKGPGWYEARFRPVDPGVYLVRARSGSQIVSAGYVHNPSTEVATGQVNEPLLRQVCEITGGTYFASAEEAPILTGTDVARYVELWPYLMLLFVFVFLADLCVRRWENVLGIADHLWSPFRRT